VISEVDIAPKFCDEAVKAILSVSSGISVGKLTGNILTSDLDYNFLIHFDGIDDKVKTYILMGSTIGNFNDEQIVNLLKRTRKICTKRDRFLIAFDTPNKEGEIIERAYNDSNGVTADFNLNILNNVNTKFQTDFVVENFEHSSIWKPHEAMIYSSVKSKQEQEVSCDGKVILHLKAGEHIHTEISRKIDLKTMRKLSNQAGFKIGRTWHEGNYWYYVVELVPDMKTGKRRASENDSMVQKRQKRIEND